MQSDFQVPSVLTCLYDFAFMSSHEIMAKGRVKKMWIYPHLGGWVGQDGDKIHKKTKKTL